MDASDLDHFFTSRWDATVKRCEKLLEPDDLGQVRRITSWDLVRKEVLQEAGTGFSRSMPYEIALMEPTLGHLRQFVNIFESQLGISADFFWGIIGLLLKLTAQDSQALSTIPRMLKSLGYKAEAFKGYYNASPEVLAALKEACFDIQIQLVGFFAIAVGSIRGGEGEEEASHGGLNEHDPWLRLQRRFTATNQDLTEALARAEKLVAVHRPGLDRQGSSGKTSAQQRFRCAVMPSKKTPRFFDRVDVFEKIDQALGGECSSTSFYAIALYGLGGIGKSSIAARYIETKFESQEYDAVFWVYAEKTASLRQSFTDIALRLKLDGAKPNSHDDNLLLVQNWLQLTECKWLIVYDNAESADVLMPYWPEACHGKAIITTRNHALAYKPATSGLEIISWDDKAGSEFLLFLLKRSIGSNIQTEADSASELSRKLSGHALAIAHMAGLIHRRSWSIAEFMRIYLKNPRKAHQSELQAVWDYSFASLGKDSRAFLGIAAFLEPETIPQFLFEFGEDWDIPEDLEFCTDDFSFSEATEPLLTLALIKRDRNARVFSCHRMVQTQFRYFLPLEERQRAFNNAVALVYRAFPKQSDSANQNQLYQHWEQCNRCLQLVLALKDNFKEDPQLGKNLNATMFCELLKDCQRYLYEINALEELDDVCKVNLVATELLDNKEQANDLTAWTWSLQASMYESTGKVQKAIELNLKGYGMRLKEVPLKGGLLGGFEQNLGYNYNTANDHETALTWFEKSKERWTDWNIKEGRGADWPTVTKTNMARCLVYLGQYDRAQELLDISIREFKQEKPISWGMLAYAYFVQGTLQRRRARLEAAEASFMEAQNLWMKGGQIRLHPFHAASIYKTGVVCLEQGKVEAAVKHLRDSLEITKFHAKVMPVEHARGLLKLSEALLQGSYSNGDEVTELRDEVGVYLRKRDPEALNIEFTSEADLDQWVPIFWR